LKNVHNATKLKNEIVQELDLDKVLLKLEEIFKSEK